MYLELIATLVAGIAAAGFVMLLNRLVGGLLPRWLAPVAAGVMMIGVTIYNEYTWYSRSVLVLPEGVVVAQSVESRSAYRPWTYLVPFVDRFVAVDTALVKQHDEQPGLRLTEVYYFGRWAPIREAPVLVDCEKNRRAIVTDAATFEDDGTVDGANWVQAGEGDPLLSTLCGAG
ncbi:hypothetical protein FMN50_11635 [Rhodobacterales bacterium]|nr:hypothetical protein FMN50_11635 [Rhodobacterales bacterium]